MNKQLDDLLKSAPLSSDLSAIISQCDKLKKQGNIPGMKSVLANHYAEVRLALEVLSMASHLLETIHQKRVEFAELDKGGRRYNKLLLCERFYATWCGTKAIGAPCGFPYGSEEELLRIHRNIQGERQSDVDIGLTGTRHPTARMTSCWFRGHRADFDSEKEAYVWLIERFLSVAPDMFENRLFAGIINGKKRRYFSMTLAGR